LGLIFAKRGNTPTDLPSVERMTEIVSWIGVALITIGALVGFTGVVATSVMLGVRHLTAAPAAGRHTAPAKHFVHAR
jgi:hypothetical protein